LGESRFFENVTKEGLRRLPERVTMHTFARDQTVGGVCLRQRREPVKGGTELRLYLLIQVADDLIDNLCGSTIVGDAKGVGRWLEGRELAVQKHGIHVVILSLG